MNNPCENAAITVSYAMLMNLIKSRRLCPCQCYKVTGFNKNMPIGSTSNPHGNVPEILYDDGTNPGVTVYVKAKSTNTLEEEGYGEFYNPNYYTDESDYSNTDGTGLYGIWDGDNPAGGNVPNYQFNQVVFWGGYAWSYKPSFIGQIGSYVSEFELDPLAWNKVPYSQTFPGGARQAYKLVIDKIKIDWRDYIRPAIIVERYNETHNVKVSFTLDSYSTMKREIFGPSSFFGNTRSPISHMGWGIYDTINRVRNPFAQLSQPLGIENCESINSFALTCNFKGRSFYDNKIHDSGMFSNYLGQKTVFSMNEFSNRSHLVFNSFFTEGTLTDYSVLFEQNYFSNDSNFENNYLGPIVLTGGTGSTGYTSVVFAKNVVDFNSQINDNYFDVNSNVEQNIIENYSSISSIWIDGTYLDYNVIELNSGIGSLRLKFRSYFQFNHISNNSSIHSINGIECEIYGNRLFNSSYIYNSIFDSSAISQNTLDHNSTLHRANFTQCSFIRNHFTNQSTLRLLNTGPISSKNFVKMNWDNVLWTASLASSTDIYYDVSKNIYKRLDGTNRLSYYNTNDTLVITDVDA